MDLPDAPTQQTEPEQATFLSTMVESATWNPGTQTLEVTFTRNGDTYTYRPVTAAEWAEMQVTPSVGRWVRQVLAGRETWV